MAGRPGKGNILDTLQQIRRGAFVEQINEQLSELTLAVFATDGDGEINIRLKLTSNQEGQVKISPEVKIKKPIKKVGDAIFYANVDGGLERDDPRQRNMFEENDELN